MLPPSPSGGSPVSPSLLPEPGVSQSSGFGLRPRILSNPPHLPAEQPAGGKNRCADDKEREDPADAAQAHGLDGLIADADIVHGVSRFLYGRMILSKKSATFWDHAPPPPRYSFEHVGAKRKERQSKRQGLAHGILCQRPFYATEPSQLTVAASTKSHLKVFSTSFRWAEKTILSIMKGDST